MSFCSSVSSIDRSRFGLQKFTRFRSR